MTPINLFADQADLIDRIRGSMGRHKSILMQSATGSGKTVMGAYMIQSAVAKGNRCGFVVPRNELLRQTAETFNAYGIEFGYFAAGYAPNPFAKGAVVFIIMALMSNAERAGCTWRSTAAAPAAMGQAMLVPLVSRGDEPDPTPAERIERPGAEMSGLTLASRVRGPRDEKGAI